jgi:hypothetical protein
MVARLGNDTPLPSRDRANACLEHYIGSIKGAQEHPLVSEFRKLGVDPERVEMLRVMHDSFGERWVTVPTNEVSTRATSFAQQAGLENGLRVDTPKLAFIFLNQLAPRFLAGPLLLPADSDSDESKEWFDHCLDAAAFALKHGVRTVYDLSEGPPVDLHDLDFGPPASYFH